MLNHTLTLQLTEQELAVCRLPAATSFPDWIGKSGFVSITRTQDELSIVCEQEAVPENVISNRNWRMIKIKGPLEFSMTGILYSLVKPLSNAGIAVFAISTYDTDYILVKAESFEAATGILSNTCIIEKQREI